MNDRVVIDPAEAEEVSPSGIVIPDTAKEKPTRGTVIAVGPGKLLDNGKRSSPSVAIGNEVIYNKYSGSEIEIDGREVKIICESDILAVVKNEPRQKGAEAAPIRFHDEDILTPILDGERIT